MAAAVGMVIPLTLAITAGSAYAAGSPPRHVAGGSSWGSRGVATDVVQIGASSYTISAESSRVPRGGVMLVHGGGWVGGSPADLQPYADQLVNLGYVVANVSTQSATTASWPAQPRDLLAAWSSFRAHAAQYQLNTAHMVLAGASAGAHIVMYAVTQMPVNQRPAAVISWSGPTDLPLLMNSPGPGCHGSGMCYYYLPLLSIVPGPLLRCSHSTCAAAEAAASPDRHLGSGFPPTLQTFYSDDLVPSSQGVLMKTALDSKHVSNVLRIYRGSGHALQGAGSAWTDSLWMIRMFAG
jgi:acetyl esterase/lipase